MASASDAESRSTTTVDGAGSSRSADVVAGVSRALARAPVLYRQTARMLLGRLPLPPPRTVSLLSDRASIVLDVLEHGVAARRKRRELQQQQQQWLQHKIHHPHMPNPPGSSGGHLGGSHPVTPPTSTPTPGRGTRFWATAKMAAPGFIRSAVQGSVLFVVYETLYDQWPLRAAMPSSSSSSSSASSASSTLTPTPPPLAGVFAIGAVAGLAHATCAAVWETVLERQRPAVPVLAGLAVSHVLTHSTLFGTYEGAKRLLLAQQQQQGGEDTSDTQFGIEYAAVVTAAGLVGGTAQGLADHVFPDTRPSDGWRALLRPARPPWAQIVRATPATALGFLALEYGRFA